VRCGAAQRASLASNLQLSHVLMASFTGSPLSPPPRCARRRSSRGVSCTPQRLHTTPSRSLFCSEGACALIHHDLTCRAARDAASTRRRPSACAAASGPRFWFLASTRSPTASTQQQQRRPGACGEGRTPSPPPPTPAPHSDEFRTRSCLVCCGCPRLQAAGQRVEEGSTTQLMPAPPRREPPRGRPSRGARLVSNTCCAAQGLGAEC